MTTNEQNETLWGFEIELRDYPRFAHRGNLYIWTELGDGQLQKITGVHCDYDVVTVHKNADIRDWLTATFSCHAGTTVYGYKSTSDRDSHAAELRHDLAQRQQTWAVAK